MKPYNQYNQPKKSIFNLSTEHKVYIGIGLLTLFILIGGAWFLSSQGVNEADKLSKPLMGKAVTVSAGHVAAGTPVQYSTNPPTGGEHYGDSTTHAGIYDTGNVPADGYLVHSLEHGAVILWYNPKKLSADQINKLKDIFNQTTGKGIMTPRESLDTPVALSSWGQVLKLKGIDQKQIKAFFDTNGGRGPESAPI